MRRLVLAAVLAAAVPLGAQAASNPISGAFESFFTFRPGTAAPPDPADYGGGGCGPAAASSWWGRFAGGGAGNSASESGGIIVQTSEGCFPSQNACLGWLRAMKTKFGEQPIYNQCRAGYQPGASVPPWWSNRSD
jgi:opacity protein-like surface antigen